MATWHEWEEHFKKQSIDRLEKLRTALEILLSDDMIKKEYRGYGFKGYGLDSLYQSINTIVKLKKRKRG